MALRQGLAQCLKNTVNRHDGMNFQKSSKHNHVEDFDHVHLGGLVHGVDAVHVDVLAGGGHVDAVAVVDEGAAGLYLGLELLQRGLVKDDGRDRKSVV